MHAGKTYSPTGARQPARQSILLQCWLIVLAYIRMGCCSGRVSCKAHQGCLADTRRSNQVAMPSAGLL